MFIKGNAWGQNDTKPNVVDIYISAYEACHFKNIYFWVRYIPSVS